MGSIKVLSQHFPGGNEENHGSFGQKSSSQYRDSNWVPPIHETGVLTTQLQCLLL
jgi:hypothetical protein